jgi:hypothetical protein
MLNRQVGTLIAFLVCGCGSSVDNGDGSRSAADTSTTQTSVQEETPADTSCVDDSTCAEGTFCDLGKCVEFYEPRHYGWACDPSLWEGADPILASKLNPCGAYVCRDLRCRSCESDADCEAGTCNDGVLREGSPVPGWGCGAAPAP